MTHFTCVIIIITIGMLIDDPDDDHTASFLVPAKSKTKRCTARQTDSARSLWEQGDDRCDDVTVMNVVMMSVVDCSLC